MPYSNNENSNKKPELVKLAALWTQEDKNGKFYLSGKLGDAKVYVLPNNFKKEGGSTQPDFFVYVQKAEPTKQSNNSGEKRYNNEEGPF